MNAYDKLLAQLHAMTAPADRRNRKSKPRPKTRSAKADGHQPAAKHPEKKRRHRRAKQPKGRR